MFVFAKMKTGKENSYVERDRKADGEKEVICLDSMKSQRLLEKIVDFSLLQRHRARGYIRCRWREVSTPCQFLCSISIKNYPESIERNPHVNYGTGSYPHLPRKLRQPKLPSSFLLPWSFFSFNCSWRLAYVSWRESGCGNQFQRRNHEIGSL